jgi:hypothetical protein
VVREIVLALAGRMAAGERVIELPLIADWPSRPRPAPVAARGVFGLCSPVDRNRAAGGERCAVLISVVRGQE